MSLFPVLPFWRHMFEPCFRFLSFWQGALQVYMRPSALVLSSDIFVIDEPRWLKVLLITAIVNHAVEDELFMFPSGGFPCPIKASVQNCTT